MNEDDVRFGFKAIRRNADSLHNILYQYRPASASNNSNNQTCDLWDHQCFSVISGYSACINFDQTVVSLEGRFPDLVADGPWMVGF